MTPLKPVTAQYSFSNNFIRGLFFFFYSHQNDPCLSVFQVFPEALFENLVMYFEGNYPALRPSSVIQYSNYSG